MFSSLEVKVLYLKPGVWFRRGRLLIVSPDSLGTACPLSGRNSTTMEALAPYMRGRRGYFGFCETPEVLIALTRWVRLRLRAALWRQWKTPRRRAALIALRVSGELRNTATSGLGSGAHRPEQSSLNGSLQCHFKSLGLPSLIEVR
jgi:RNA-directed DNA polymerase